MRGFAPSGREFDAAVAATADDVLNHHAQADADPVEWQRRYCFAHRAERQRSWLVANLLGPPNSLNAGPLRDTTPDDTSPDALPEPATADHAPHRGVGSGGARDRLHGLYVLEQVVRPDCLRDDALGGPNPAPWLTRVYQFRWLHLFLPVGTFHRVPWRTYIYARKEVQGPLDPEHDWTETGPWPSGLRRGPPNVPGWRDVSYPGCASDRLLDAVLNAHQVLPCFVVRSRRFFSPRVGMHIAINALMRRLADPGLGMRIDDGGSTAISCFVASTLPSDVHRPSAAWLAKAPAQLKHVQNLAPQNFVDERDPCASRNPRLVAHNGGALAHETMEGPCLCCQCTLEKTLGEVSKRRSVREMAYFCSACALTEVHAIRRGLGTAEQPKEEATLRPNCSALLGPLLIELRAVTMELVGIERTMLQKLISHSNGGESTAWAAFAQLPTTREAMLAMDAAPVAKIATADAWARFRGTDLEHWLALLEQPGLAVAPVQEMDVAGWTPGAGDGAHVRFAVMSALFPRFAIFRAEAQFVWADVASRRAGDSSPCTRRFSTRTAWRRFCARRPPSTARLHPRRRPAVPVVPRRGRARLRRSRSAGSRPPPLGKSGRAAGRRGRTSRPAASARWRGSSAPWACKN